MKTILVTGSTGFVGTHFIEHVKDNYIVLGIDYRNEGVKISHPNVSYLRGDIKDRAFLDQIISKNKPELILHLAAKTTQWFDDAKSTVEVNTLGTLNILDSVLALKKNSSYNPRVLYVSTSEVYGKTINPTLINEQAPMFPINNYAASKASADIISYSYSMMNKLNIIIARPFTHTGALQKKGFFVPDIASQIAGIEAGIIENGEIHIGNLDAVRDYLDVKDVVRAYITLLELSCEPGTIFNVCSSKPVRVRDIFESLLRLSSSEIKIVPDPRRIRPSDIPVYIGDNSKIISSTSWAPQVNIEDTLESTLTYWRNLLS